MNDCSDWCRMVFLKLILGFEGIIILVGGGVYLCYLIMVDFEMWVDLCECSRVFLMFWELIWLKDDFMCSVFWCWFC